MRTNPEYFDLLISGSFIPQEIRTQTSTHGLDFVRRAPIYVADRLFYTPFCLSQQERLTIQIMQILGRSAIGTMHTGLLEQRPLKPIPIRRPDISLDRVDGARLARNTHWQHFLERYTIPRSELINTTAEVLRWVYGFPEGSIYEVARYKIGLALVQDPSENEIKRIFTPRTTM